MRRYPAAALLLVAGVACQGDPAPPDERRSLSVSEVLGGEPDAGYARALEPRRFTFPDDHGPHLEYRNEWWYFTGNLSDATGRRFGYQFTIFRTALRPVAFTRDSAWASTQVYMGHLAVGDLAAGRFHAFDRFARGALGLAGAQGAPLRVWVEDWELAAAGTTPTAAEGLPPLRLVAREGEVALELRLEAIRPVVLQGDSGLSRKGGAPGNASYYYSVTRLRTAGAVEIAGQTWEVSGSSWLDREWSTSALEPEQAGWDWFSLQLSDGTDLMLYLMRLHDGGLDTTSSGALVAPDGISRTLDSRQFTIEVLDTWRAGDGVEYPASWRVRVPSERIDLRVEPLLRDQELRLAFRYWEGAVHASGRSGDADIQGQGFVELTGYADR